MEFGPNSIIVDDLTEEAELAAETSVSRSGNATENGKYCDNLMPDNGDAESAASAPSYDAASKRVPIDTLARLFPHVKRSVLKFTLDKCSGDVLRAIEQLVYHNNPHAAAAGWLSNLFSSLPQVSKLLGFLWLHQSANHRHMSSNVTDLPSRSARTALIFHV